MNQADLKLLLERIEWHPHRYEDGEIEPYCPYCLGDGEANTSGCYRYHEFWCKLALFMIGNGIPVHRVTRIDEECEMTKEVDPVWKTIGADLKLPEKPENPPSQLIHESDVPKEES